MEQSVKDFFANYQERVRRHYRRHLIAYKKSGTQYNNQIIVNSTRMLQEVGTLGYEMRALAHLGNGNLNQAIADMNSFINDLPDVANLYSMRGAF